MGKYEPDELLACSEVELADQIKTATESLLYQLEPLVEISPSAKTI